MTGVEDFQLAVLRRTTKEVLAALGGQLLRLERRNECSRVSLEERGSF
jgi:hypothetical protein